MVLSRGMIRNMPVFFAEATSQATQNFENYI